MAQSNQLLDCPMRREFLLKKMQERTPDELIEQIQQAAKGDPRKEFNKGVAATCQWLLGLGDKPFGGNDDATQ
ncbi:MULTISPECIES: hypothetical protein [Vibrio]|uniref:Uncharacterized protein n=1 Tax=Vibrio algicola TaxID=2662262 RepID=A0A5Q0TJ71_9VIBR|nr:hypothetical protein [Vibrio algicola]